MAKQRTTTVNIDYKVNTVDLEKGNSLLNRVNQSTDKLKQATNNFGQSAGKSFQSASKHIEGMEIELARLRQQIKLTSTQDTARLQQLSGQYKALKQQVDAYNKSLFQQATATKQTAQATQGLATQFNQVLQAVKLFIAAGVAREVLNLSLEMAKLNGNVEGVERAFKRAFPGAEAILLDLRKATHGAVSDFELMQRTLQATNLGVSVEHLGVLFEFAATRAQQTGESVDYLVDSIVRGIGRKSLLILDNLGLSAVRLKEQFNGASLASQSVADVTAGVAEIAKVELAKMGGYLETSATQVDQLTVSWRELREEAARAFSEGETGGIIGIIKDYVDSFKALIEAHNRGIDVSEVFAERQRKEIAQISANEFMTRTLTGTKQEQIAVLEEEIQAITSQIGAYAKSRDATQETIKWLREEIVAGRGNLYVIEENIELLKKGLKPKEEDALIDQEILKILQSKLLLLRQVNKEQKESNAEDRSLVTDPVRLFDPGKSAKVPFDKQALKQPLVDTQKALQESADQLFVALPVTVKPGPFKPDAWQKIADEFADNWQNIVSSGIADTTDVINSFVQKQADSYDIQLNQLRAFYDEQMNLAGDNERAKMELAVKRDREEQKLRKKAFEADKEAKRLTTLINGAAGVVNAFATLPYPAALVASVLIAAQTAAQIAIINNARYKGFKDGVIDLNGPGTKTSDSIPARLSRGESVMTADETASSKGIFKAVRARKLNDKVLKEITSGRSGGAIAPGMDIGPIVEGLKDLKNSQPDIVLRSNLVYEGRRRSDRYKQWIRSKSMGS